MEEFRVTLSEEQPDYIHAVTVDVSLHYLVQSVFYWRFDQHIIINFDSKPWYFIANNKFTKH